MTAPYVLGPEPLAPRNDSQAPGRRLHMAKRRGPRRRRRRNDYGPKEPKEGKLEFQGVVQEALPNAMFRVEAENGLMVLATLSGRMRRHYVRVLLGDRVTVEVSAYEPTRGRITYRHR